MASVEDLIPHRAPWLLVDRVVESGEGRVRAEKTLCVDDPLLADGLPETLVMEALAQAAACVRGGERGQHRGFLVAATKFEFPRRARAGEILTLRAERTATLGALHRFSAEAAVGDEIVAKGELSFAIEGG
jgi:3-hydroxyacyl-[acyl-carrier-protein] dehydratase